MGWITEVLDNWRCSKAMRDQDKRCREWLKTQPELEECSGCQGFGEILDPVLLRVETCSRCHGDGVLQSTAARQAPERGQSS
jgi:DnaJ-class molecular chaperone